MEGIINQKQKQKQKQKNGYSNTIIKIIKIKIIKIKIIKHFYHFLANHQILLIFYFLCKYKNK
jgi:hypothetical protein